MKAIPVPGISSAILATGRKNGGDMVCVKSENESGGLYPWHGDQIQFSPPKILNGKMDVEGQKNYFVFGNKGNDIIVHIPFVVKPETRTCLQSLFKDKKIVFKVELKGSDARVILAINGKIQKNADGDSIETLVSSSGTFIRVEMNESDIVHQNVIQLSTQGGTQYIAIYSVQIAFM